MQDLIVMERKFYQLLQDGEFPAALQLMITIRTNLMKLMQFHCIKEMKERIERGYEVVYQKMEYSLATVCAIFDARCYEKLLVGYKLMGDQNVTNKIKDCYVNEIDTSLSKIALSFVLKSKKVAPELVMKMDLAELCKSITYEDSLPCLLEMFSILTDILFNYYSMYNWHIYRKEYACYVCFVLFVWFGFVLSKNFSKQKSKNHSLSAQGSAVYNEEFHDFEMVNTFVSKTRKVIWDHMQTRVALFLNSNDNSLLKIEKFLELFHAVSMFCEMGEEFSESDSHKLSGSLKIKSKTYFMLFHKDTLDVSNLLN